MRRWVGACLVLLLGLDVLVGAVGVPLAGLWAYDPQRGWLVTGLRELVLLAMAAGAPLLGGMLVVVAGLALATRSPAAGWLALGVGVMHVGVPVAGLGLCVAAVGLLRQGEESP